MSDQEQDKKEGSKVPASKGRKSKKNIAELVLEISHKVAIPLMISCK